MFNVSSYELRNNLSVSDAKTPLYEKKVSLFGKVTFLVLFNDIYIFFQNVVLFNDTYIFFQNVIICSVSKSKVAV